MQRRFVPLLVLAGLCEHPRAPESTREHPRVPESTREHPRLLLVLAGLTVALAHGANDVGVAVALLAEITRDHPRLTEMTRE